MTLFDFVFVITIAAVIGLFIAWFGLDDDEKRDL